MRRPQDVLREFIGRYVPARDVADDQDLIDTGVIDSLFLIEMLTFAEPTFAIKVEMDDMVLDHFRTLDAFAAFIAAKRGRGAV